MGLVPKTFYERALMIDSGPLITLYSSNDLRQQSVEDILRDYQRDEYPICVTEFVIAEVQRNVCQNENVEQGIRFLDDIYDGSVNIVQGGENDVMEAVNIIKKKLNDQTITFTDALSMAVMKRMGIIKVFTYDIDFSFLGFVIVSV